MNPSARGLRRQFFRLLPLFLLLLCLSLPADAAAASGRPVRITGCRLTSASRIEVTASVSSLRSVSGSKCYLFALSSGDTKIPAKAKPIQTKRKAKKLRFSFALNKTKSSSRLYSHFVVAARKNGKYTIISNTRYLSNPSRTAKYKYRFPQASSKKGLQVSASMLEDAEELNVQHSVLNIVFTELISAKSEQNKQASYAYKYHGKTYWYRKSIVDSYDRQLIALKSNGTVISAVLLLGWRNDLKELIYPSGRVHGHSFYAWNTKSAAAREQLQAAISFLAERYTDSSSKYGRIANWIVGNEVNNYKVYNYAGEKTLTQYAQIYASAFRMTYNTVSSVYSNARVYISLDHLWNTNWVSGTFASRKMLDSFASALAAQGTIPWNLAYHPYGSPLTEPKFWENKNHQLTQSLTSPVINMANIGLLTSYIRRTYGSSTRIILSEQGFTSVQRRKNVEKEQSAAIVYSYYLTEADDMIDSFIMNRHVDHQAEVAQGLNLGLWTTTNGTNPEWANEKKDSWNVFKYMDTDQSPLVADAALSQIGAGSWSELIPGYSPALYSKTSIASAPLEQGVSYSGSAFSGDWKKYGAAASLKRSGKAIRVYHDGGRNRSCLWGFTQSFKNGRSLSGAPRFSATVRTNGVIGSNVVFKLRFYSGKHIFESIGVLPANRKIRVSAALQSWPFRNQITKMQLLLAPSGGTWKSNAYLELTDVTVG